MTNSDEQTSAIPAAAVDAAALGIHIQGGVSVPLARQYARAALEVAAPHMLAGVLESAADDVHDRAIGLDSKALTDQRGYMQRHNVSSVALWLRGRADRLRPPS